MAVFSAQGWESAHWSRLGNPQASDTEILEYAQKHGYLIFTHDLDFGALLAATQATGPSVIQVRTQDISPEAIGLLVSQTITRLQEELKQGALIGIEPGRARIRLLPLG